MSDVVDKNWKQNLVDQLILNGLTRKKVNVPKNIERSEFEEFLDLLQAAVMVTMHLPLFRMPGCENLPNVITSQYNLLQIDTNKKIEHLFIYGTGEDYLNDTNLERHREFVHALGNRIFDEIFTAAKIEGFDYSKKDVMEAIFLDVNLAKGYDRILVNLAKLIKGIEKFSDVQIDAAFAIEIYFRLIEGVEVQLSQDLSKGDLEVAKGLAAKALIEMTSQEKLKDVRTTLVSALFKPIQFYTIKPFPIANTLVGMFLGFLQFHKIGLPLVPYAKPLSAFYTWAFDADDSDNESLVKYVNIYDGNVDISGVLDKYLELVVESLDALHKQLLNMKYTRAILKNLLKKAGVYNNRQRHVILEALLHVDAEFSASDHQSFYNIAYSTAHADLEELEKDGFLKSVKIKKRHVFIAADDVKERFKQMLPEELRKSVFDLSADQKFKGLASDDWVAPEYLIERAWNSFLS